MNEEHPSENCTVYSPYDLARFLAGAVPPRRQERIRQHLQTCSHCQRRIHELNSLQGLLRRYQDVPLPRSFLVSAQDVRRRRTLWYPILRSATTAAAMLVLLLFLGGLLQPALLGLSRQLPGAGQGATPLPVAVEPVSTWRARPTLVSTGSSTPAVPTAAVAILSTSDAYPRPTESPPRTCATVSQPPAAPAAQVEGAPPSVLWSAIHLGGLSVLGALAGLTWLAYRHERPFIG